MKKVVVFGAGILGKCAIEYYKNFYNISFIVDNDKNKWGKSIDGIEIRKPNELVKDKNICIIVPKGRYFEEICAQIEEMNMAKSIIVFEISDRLQYFNVYDESAYGIEKVVSFKGGLGNQLFQYCFLLWLEEKGYYVKANLDYYEWPGSRPFCLNKIFKNLPLIEDRVNNRDCSLMYVEPDVRSNYGEYPKSVFNDFRYRYYDGYFQTYKIPALVEGKLSNIIDVNELKLLMSSRLIKVIDTCNTVSLHIRRGDYINEDVKDIYMGICDLDYYIDAIKYMENHVKEPSFVVFTDDIDYAKSCIHIEGAIYAEEELDKVHFDWCELLIMSMCKNNIIANSSFSWWGAWLNKQPNKIVIAPKRWVNYSSQLDICPPEWIRL